MNLFKSELMRLLKSKVIYLCLAIILLSSIITIISRINDFGYNYDWLFIFLSTHSFGIYTILPVILPIVVCIPYTSTVYEDMHTRYINFLVSRSSFRKYILIKMLFNTMVPAVLVTINILISFILSKLMFKNPIGDITGIVDNPMFANLINNNRIGMFLLLIIGISVVFSCIFTSIGLVSTIYIQNKYISIALPFFLYIITGVIALTIDKIYLHMATIFSGYMYTNNLFITSLIIGLVIILVSNLLFYLHLYRKGI